MDDLETKIREAAERAVQIGQSQIRDDWSNITVGGEVVVEGCHRDHALGLARGERARMAATLRAFVRIADARYQPRADVKPEANPSRRASFGPTGAQWGNEEDVAAVAPAPQPSSAPARLSGETETCAATDIMSNGPGRQDRACGMAAEVLVKGRPLCPECSGLSDAQIAALPVESEKGESAPDDATEEAIGIVARANLNERHRHGDGGAAATLRHLIAHSPNGTTARLVREIAAALTRARAEGAERAGRVPVETVGREAFEASREIVRRLAAVTDFGPIRGGTMDRIMSDARALVALMGDGS